MEFDNSFDGPLPPAVQPISGLVLIARVIWSELAALFSGGRT